MNSVNGTVAKSMLEVDISTLSIDDALFVVNMVRAKNQEDRVLIKMTQAQARGVEMSNLNKTYAALQNLSSGFPANASPTTKAEKISGYATDGYAKEQAANDALQNAGLINKDSGLGLYGVGINGRNQQTGPYAINSSTTKLQIDNAMTTLKARIDSLSSTSQTDMIELQSATSGYQASIEATSGNIKKFADIKSKIQNMS